jgi:hypothetical protein
MRYNPKRFLLSATANMSNGHDGANGLAGIIKRDKNKRM